MEVTRYGTLTGQEIRNSSKYYTVVTNEMHIS